MYTKEEAEKVAQQMKKHYVYEVIISDGDKDTYELSGKKKEPVVKQEKNAIGKIKIKI